VKGVFYNENDRRKAAWLRHLIEEGVIAHGVVDERSIHEVQPEDVAGFDQCHFFAGIGLWSLCLRRAGWPDDRPVWTGSCPCGPFSAAGLRKGFDDPRHLWPEWFRLIRERRPDVLFGEQSADADAWLDLVQTDLEGCRYAFGAADIPAAGFGGAHRRQRFGFVADADNAEWWSDRAPWHDGRWPKTGWIKGHGHPRDGGEAGWLAAVDGGHTGPERLQRGGQHGQLSPDGRACDWLPCSDGAWRPVESGTFPLAHEDPARLVRLRGYGDAIDVEAFTNLIAAYMDAAPGLRAAA
jgi:DNA (cytosine-5)-methyltransferase 1